MAVEGKKEKLPLPGKLPSLPVQALGITENMMILKYSLARSSADINQNRSIEIRRSTLIYTNQISGFL